MFFVSQQFLQRVAGLGVAVAQFVGDVEENHLHAHALGQHRQLAADIAVADDAENLAAHFQAVVGALVPAAVMRRDRARKDAAQQHDDFADHQFGH
jgi:hypothetical protein